MADPNKGGVFLSALKEKNEVRRQQQQQLKTAQSTQRIQAKQSALSLTNKKKSFFGSFILSSKTSKSSSNDLHKLENAQQQQVTVETTTTTTTTTREDDETVVVRTERTRSARATVNHHPMGEEKVEVETSTVRIPSHDMRRNSHLNVSPSTSGDVVSASSTATATRIELVEDKSSGVPATKLVVEETSIAVTTPPSRDFHHIGERSRRGSTTAVDKRLSSTTTYVREASTDGSTRDRTHSMATIDDVYGRLGKESNRGFEMTNPMLVSAPPRRSLAATSSNNGPIMTEAKRTSLIQSAPHVDQVILLERRNTRAGRSGSIDVRSAHPSHDHPPVEASQE